MNDGLCENCGEPEEGSEVCKVPLRRKESKKETQKQRKTRVRRENQSGMLYYWIASGVRPRRTPKPKAVARALRRHPPTTCINCGITLVWWPARGAYEDEEGTDRICPAPRKPGERHEHLPANGKRQSPFVGDRGGVSR